MVFTIRVDLIWARVYWWWDNLLLVDSICICL